MVHNCPDTFIYHLDNPAHVCYHVPHTRGVTGTGDTVYTISSVQFISVHDEFGVYIIGETLLHY